jgi:gamma-D-glutamyl-L-lysine dipeptidyl-peptidase
LGEFSLIFETKWLVNVPVATIWTSIDSPRDIDKGAISNPVQMDEWLNGLTVKNRLKLCEQNLIQTQVLFAHEVYLVKEWRGWAEIVIPDQPTSKNENGYMGWIPIEQLIRCEGWQLENDPVVVVTSKKAFLYDEHYEPYMELSFQTVLPYLKEQYGKALVQTPSGTGWINVENVKIYESMKMIQKGNGNDIVSTAVKFLDLPYLWGGMSSYGYDCSGFCYSIYKANGYMIPRDAVDQAKAGKIIEAAEMEPGDLLFFAQENGKGRIHHVGIYYGNGMMIHSPSTGKSVEIVAVKGTKYENELCTIRRYWKS